MKRDWKRRIEGYVNHRIRRLGKKHVEKNDLLALRQNQGPE